MKKYLRKCSLAEISQRLSDNSYSLIDYINESCDYLEEIDSLVQSFLPEDNRRSRVLNEAKALLDKYPDSDSRPPLFGALVGVKDVFNVDGLPTLAGSKLPPSCFAGEEAISVTKLKQAGALILGKTVTTEFAYFSPGATANPHNLNHTPGGSSSGSAAAVAAGFVPLALGTQTIASVIRPAAYCGIIGFKPSYGRIPVNGLFPLAPSADHIGLFAQDLTSIALAAKILLNGWKDSSINTDKFVEPRSFCLGIPASEYISQVEDEELITEFESLLSDLKHKGFVIKETDLFNDIEKINSVHGKLIARDFYLTHQRLYPKFANLYSPHSLKLYMTGKDVAQEDFLQYKTLQIEYRERVTALMQNDGIDLWLTPATTTTAPATLKQTGSPLMSLPWTFTGLPSLTLPNRDEKRDLPAGIQLVTGYNQDELLLNYAEYCNPRKI